MHSMEIGEIETLLGHFERGHIRRIMPENFGRTAKVSGHVDETVHQGGQERHQQGLGRGIIRALGMQTMKCC